MQSAPLQDSAGAGHGHPLGLQGPMQLAERPQAHTDPRHKDRARDGDVHPGPLPRGEVGG